MLLLLLFALSVAIAVLKVSTTVILRVTPKAMTKKIDR